MTEILNYPGFIALEHLEYLFELREFPAPDAKFVPANAAIVFVDKKIVCGGFLFLSDANAAIIGHLVSDPCAPGAIRNQCLDQLIKHLTAKAETLGYGMVCCSTNIPRLMDRFEKLDFTKTDEGVSNFGRVLCR